MQMTINLRLIQDYNSVAIYLHSPIRVTRVRLQGHYIIVYVREHKHTSLIKCWVKTA
jgi:hypothetical protein